MTLRQEGQLAQMLGIVERLMQRDREPQPACDVIDNRLKDQRNALSVLVRMHCVRTWKQRTYSNHWRRVYEVTEYGREWFNYKRETYKVSLAVNL